MLLAVLAIVVALSHGISVVFTPNELLRRSGKRPFRAAMVSFTVDFDTLYAVARLLAFPSFRFHKIYERIREPPDRIESLRRFINITRFHATIFSVAKLNRNLSLALSAFHTPYGTTLLRTHGLTTNTFRIDRATQLRAWKIAITQLGQMETTYFFQKLAKNHIEDHWTFLVEKIDPTELTPDILATMFVTDRTSFLSNRIRVLRDYLITSTSDIDGFIRGLCVLLATGKKTESCFILINQLAWELIRKVTPRDSNLSDKELCNQIYDQLVIVTESVQTRSLWGVIALLIEYLFDFDDMDPVDLFSRARWLVERAVPDMVSPALSRRLLLRLKPTLQAPSVEMELPLHHLASTCLDLATRRNVWLRRGPFVWSSLPKEFKFSSPLRFQRKMAATTPTLYLNAVAKITVEGQVITQSIPILMTNLSDAQLKDALMKPYMTHFVLNALPYFIRAEKKGKLHQLLNCNLSNWDEFFDYTLKTLGVSVKKKFSTWHLQSYFTFTELCSLVAMQH